MTWLGMDGERECDRKWGERNGEGVTGNGEREEWRGMDGERERE